MRSLRSRLVLLWALSLLAALAVAAPLLQLYRDQGRALEGRDSLRLARVCDLLADRYAYYVAGWTGPDNGVADPDFRAGLQAVRAATLRDAPIPPHDPSALDLGIWQAEAGILVPAIAPPAIADPAIADPATGAAIAAAAAEAISNQRPASARRISEASVILVHACPLPGPIDGLAAFVIARADPTPGWREARIGLGVLTALVLAVTIGVGIVLFGYTSRIARIEAALRQPGPHLPRLPLTGERDLDRIVAAYNQAADSLAATRTREAALAAQVARSEQLAALGRVAAGLAHELRNPLAAMRLRAENALAGEPARAPAALSTILTQVARLDRLAGELLEMTRPRSPAPEPVDLPGFLAADLPPGASVDAPAATVALDPALLRRVLGNLLANAARAGAPITLRAHLTPGQLAIAVTDSGPGIPAALRDTLFDPFVTGHADGTGLGLAIAREAAIALGGQLALTDPGGPGGATFTLTIPVPWPAS